ncbi:MAG TPA: ankyrin repeat domain-containing protein [Spirochaetota bacterium]|nr:ankyrin repeat domain-containing protein [Spirochaetota bacterium]
MFIGNSLEQLSSQILTIDPPKIKIITPDIPNDLDTITHKSLEKNQKYRYQLMTEVNEDLTRWKENKPIKAKPPTTFQKITKWVKRNPLKTGIVAASFVAAIILLIFGWITINEIIRQKNIAIENLKRVSINKSKLNLDTKYYQDALINLYKSINYSKNISPTQQVYYNNIIKHNFECLSTFFWDNNRIQSMDSNRDIIVCGSSGKKNNLIVLNSKTFEKITVLDKHKDSITNVRFSIDKSYFITGSKDKTVNIWNSKSLELLNSDRIKLADCINDIEFSNDGKYFIISTGGYREQNNIIYLFDAKTLKPIKSINSDFKYLTSIAFTNDLNFLIAGNNNSIRIWNLNDIIASDATDNYKTIENCHDARISSILFINDDKTMITSSWDNTIKFWDFSALRLIKSLNAHDDIVNTIKIYNEKYLISISNDKTIKFRDLNTFNLLLVLKGHNNSVNDLCFLNNSLYTCSDDSTIKIWNIKDIGDNIFLEESISNIALSPNSKYLAVANSLSNIVNIYEYQKDNSFQNGFVKIEHDDIISDLIFSNDSKTLFCASKKSIIIYDLLKDKKELLCYDITDDIITSLSVSPDLKYIITGSLLNKIVIWNIKNKKRITIENLRHNDLINSISVSPDNNYFASVSRDSLVVLRSLNEFKEITILRGHTDSVLKAVFSPDSRYLITCSRDKTIKIWDVKSLEQVKNIEILNEPSFIAISNDSKFLLCGTVAGSLLLWDYKNYEFIFKYDILKNESVNNIVISSNSDYIYACSESKIVKEEIKTSYSKNDIKRYYDYYIPYDLDQNDQLIFKNDIVEILKNRNSDDKYVNYFKNSKIDYKDLFSNEYENNISYLFFYSIKNSDTLLLKSLLKSNNNIINILDSLGNNGLYYAVNQRNIKIVKLLIKNKIDVNFKDNNGYTPLYYASKNGYTEICEFLIKNKALIIDDNIKLSSLYIAVIENQIETLKVLLKYVDKKYLYIEDSDGKSLLDLIQNNLNKDIQKLLLQS